MKIKWLDRRIAAPGPYLCLCLNEEEYLAAMKHCKIKHPGPWLSTTQANATTHYLTHDEYGLVCIVTMGTWEGRDPVEVAGLLVHEAVHVWQEYAARIGETHPGTEQEAYAIQAVAQELMAEFARRIGARK